MEPKIISQSPISMAEAKLEIERIRKRGEEPTIRISKMEDYLNSFSVLAESRVKAVIDAIRKLDVPRLRDEHIIKIVDLMPRSVDELKIIMQGSVVTISAENMKKIVDAVNSASEKK